MSNDKLLECVEVIPSRDPVGSVIWMHGLGADGYDFEPVAAQLNQMMQAPLRYVLPHAPSLPVTINMGMRMPAWFDMLDIVVPRKVDWKSVENSHQRILQLIEREKQKGFSSDQIVLAGFSQGGAMALYTGLKYGQRLGGIVALSTYFLADNGIAEAFWKDVTEESKATPILMQHGLRDQIIAHSYGVDSRKVLEAQGFEVEWDEYMMAHAVCPEEIARIGSWLDARFNSV